MNQAIILRGNIEKVFYAGPKFSAGRLRGTDGKSHSFAGNLFATEGQHIALAGRWETHPDGNWSRCGTTQTRHIL